MNLRMNPVLCVGCTVIDFVTINDNFPEEDTDRRCLDGFWQRGGNASNVSTVLRLLGSDVDFFGMLSHAGAFRVLLDDLHRRGIDVQHCPHTEMDPPFSSVIIVKATGSRTIVHCNKNYPYVTWQDFSKIDLKRYGWIHFEARKASETIKMMRAVQEHNRMNEERIIISLDFESLFEANLPLCGLCDYVVFSKELANQQGWQTAQETCTELAHRVKPNCPSIICPWGNTGAVCLDATTQNLHNGPAYEPKQIVDTLGAGDSFMAGFIYATYALRQSLPDAVDLANRVAGHKISQFGYDHIAQLQKDNKPGNI
ncbi:ketohexokinase isoform X3 [Drosophila grimshawi]|uniref:ketohexokinase isoform X3 n=1 Tax=Drosophila grimshawi TaxID=7222 RepID=UPI000C87071A|nr:ketohexokinase isoform X3 [Drosophila grimshawi]